MTEQELTVSATVSLGCCAFFLFMGLRKCRLVWQERQPLRDLERVTDMVRNAKDIWEAVVTGTMTAEQFISQIDRKAMSYVRADHGIGNVSDGDGVDVAVGSGKPGGGDSAAGNVVATPQAKPGATGA